MKEPPNKKGPTRLAIGTEDGFSTDSKEFQVEEKTKLVILPDWDEVALPNPDLPEIVQVSWLMGLCHTVCYKIHPCISIKGCVGPSVTSFLLSKKGIIMAALHTTTSSTTSLPGRIVVPTGTCM